MLNQPPQGDETERRRGREASDQKEEAAVGHVLPMASDQARQIAAGEQRQQPQSHQQRLASRRRQPREPRPARRGGGQFADRKRVGEGKSVSGRVDLGGRRRIKKKKKKR